MVKSVSVAYCGGCNAAYDRVGFVRSLLDDLAATGCAIRLADMTEPVDIASIVAGCRAICVAERADRPLGHNALRNWSGQP
ncbi:MAG: hypothetical protein LBN33_09110 [Desulfovibrio sp.]|nr:hypothetical protein [Desulfovibrio sp.]